MPYREPDPSDPHHLVGVEVPAGEEAHVEMAYAFAEEFMRSGYTQHALLKLFENPFYRSAYGARELLGQQKIETIVEDVFQVWGRLRPVDHETVPEPLVQLSAPGPNPKRGDV